MLTNLRATAGMTAPLGSKTVPKRLPPVAARSGTAAAIRRNTTAKLDRGALTLVTKKIDFKASIVYLGDRGTTPRARANGAIHSCFASDSFPAGEDDTGFENPGTFGAVETLSVETL